MLRPEGPERKLTAIHRENDGSGHYVSGCGVHSWGNVSKAIDRIRQVLPMAPSEQVTHFRQEARHARHAPPTTTTLTASMVAAAEPAPVCKRVDSTLTQVLCALRALMLE